MSHIHSKIVSMNIQINETDARNYSIRRNREPPKARLPDDKRGGQPSMAPNAMACGVVMDCSHFLTHEPNDMELNSELRDVAPLSTSKPS